MVTQRRDLTKVPAGQVWTDFAVCGHPPTRYVQSLGAVPSRRTLPVCGHAPTTYVQSPARLATKKSNWPSVAARKRAVTRAGGLLERLFRTAKSGCHANGWSVTNSEAFVVRYQHAALSRAHPSQQARANWVQRSPTPSIPHCAKLRRSSVRNIVGQQLRHLPRRFPPMPLCASVFCLGDRGRRSPGCSRSTQEPRAHGAARDICVVAHQFHDFVGAQVRFVRPRIPQSADDLHIRGRHQTARRPDGPSWKTTPGCASIRSPSSTSNAHGTRARHPVRRACEDC